MIEWLIGVLFTMGVVIASYETKPVDGLWREVGFVFVVFLACVLLWPMCLGYAICDYLKETKGTQNVRDPLCQDDLRQTFVAGAAWWEWMQTGSTICSGDRHIAEKEAEKRFYVSNQTGT